MTIEKVGKIKRELLSGEHYFQSLLEQSYIEQILSNTELEKIQFDCLALLAKKTEQFNSSDSSSIPIEKAQDILSSIMFTASVYLKTYLNPDDAVVALKKMGMEAVYTNGRKRIDKLVWQAKMRHTALISHLLKTKNVFYSDTLIDGIKGFFKLYYPDFAAHEIHITVDYPAYNKSERLLGIEFICEYLEHIYYENLFCSHFSNEDIHHLLCGYDENYDSLLFNIYEVVLASSLGCVLASLNTNRLEVTPQIQSFLYCHFADKECDEIEQMLAFALSKLGVSLSFSNGLMEYAKQSLPLLSLAIKKSIKTKSLEQIFIASKYQEDNPKLIVSYGERMNDTLYCKILDEFMSCPSMLAKIEIMKNQIHSLADLEDLLLDSLLNIDEITEILKSLRPTEIAALMKKYTLEYEMNFTQLRDCEKTLYNGLLRLKASLPLNQQILLENAVKILEVN